MGLCKFLEFKDLKLLHTSLIHFVKNLIQFIINAIAPFQFLCWLVDRLCVRIRL